MTAAFRFAVAALCFTACATASTRPPEIDAWAAARDLVAALPPAGQDKWGRLTRERQDEIVRTAEPFLVRWKAGDSQALAVVLGTFSSLWNDENEPAPVHCSVWDRIICY